MTNSRENAAKNFLELASEQRLDILLNLLEKKAKVSVMAKKLGATIQEVYRNFERLSRAGLIAKDLDDYYHLTVYGRTICSQMPSIVFLSENQRYFEKHDFGDIPIKFIMRIGALAGGNHIDGVVKVLEKWKMIYQNANEFIYEMLSEVPLDLIEPIMKKVKNGVSFHYIFAENVIVPKGRKELLKKFGFYSLLDKGLIERRMRKKVKVVVVLNEKEACVMFPDLDGKPDMTEMFYGDDPLFHEWCLDYFRYCWYNAESFQESKLKEETE